MSAVIETEQELTGEALRILQQNLPPHKVAAVVELRRVAGLTR
jgi:hypothetical protein